MKITRSTLVIAGCFSLAVLAVPVIAPKTAHALAATLVQVSNTATNPVIGQDVDSPGRSPYQSENSCIVSGTVCQITLTQVPANKRLVVTNVSSVVTSKGGVMSAVLSQQGTVNTGSLAVLQTLQGTDGSGNSQYMTNQHATFYIEAGFVPFFQLTTNLGNTYLFVDVTVTGYLVDLTQ